LALPVWADWVTTTINTGTNPQAVAVNPVTNKIYVANYYSDNVTVIDGATNGTITVSAGDGPNAVVVNPVTNKIYTVNATSNNITVIDGATNNTTTVSAGDGPYAVAVNPVTNKIYVANYGSSNVTVIDGATNGTTTVSAGDGPCAVALNPVTNKIYVANWNSNNVTVIDGATNDTTTVSAGTNPLAVAVNPVTNKIYVANYGSSNVTVVDGATNGTITVSAGDSPHAIALNPVTNKIYVANDYSDNVTVITVALENDTKVRTEISYTGNTTGQKQPAVGGKTVNRLFPYHNNIMGTLNNTSNTQQEWKWANITYGSGTDSTHWSWNWGTDSLIWGENFICVQPLEMDAAITNNEGLGTPFGGNRVVFPIYRLYPPSTLTITATATTGGTITPNGDVIVPYGEDTTFTITPVVNYQIDNVLVDGVSVGVVTSYPFTDVTDNHTIHAMFSITATPGWAQKESIVTPHTDKTIKDGGALVGIPGTGKDPAKLYAFLGTKTNRVKIYTVGSGWSESASDSMIFGHKYKATTGEINPDKFNKKFPGKGAALCYDGVSKIYATKGNGTNEFFVYDMISDAGWTAKAFVPTPKGLKGGTSIRYYDGKVYLMAGGQKKDPTVNNFWVYEPTADSAGGTPWTALGKLPLGPNTKVWKDGASIIEVGGTFYAVKSADKTNLFYAYDWGTSTWLDKEPIPIDDSSYHKYKKKLIVKDGACTATDGSVIYATKGGGTEVFWKYTPGTPGIWERLNRMPIEKADKKHAPKTGAAMAYVDGAVYLLVGNKQVDYWRYEPGAEKTQVIRNKAQVIQTVNSTSVIRNPQFSFDISPNPFSKLTTIRYTVPISSKVSIKLYNASGRLIQTLNDGYLSAGNYTTTLSNIASGVYFLKYESNTNKSKLKLIVQ
jgi:YVTN family beta-propeller protein